MKDAGSENGADAGRLGLTGAFLLVDFGIVAAPADEQDHDGGQQAQPEHHAPAIFRTNPGRQGAGQKGGDARTDRSGALHRADRPAAVFGPDQFAEQHSADRPFGPEAQALHYAQGQQLVGVLSEA